MKALILTGKFGMGHWSAAQALAQQLQDEGHQAAVIDLFAYALPELAPSMYRGFQVLVRYMGGVYNLYHRATRNAENEGPLISLLWSRLGGLMGAVRPNVILSTHPVCSCAAARYKRDAGTPVPLITCITDVTSHSEWLHPETDCYLVPSPGVREALAEKGVARTRIVVSGIPVRAGFAAARRQDGPRQLLIMGGGLGLMPRGDAFYEALNGLEGVRTTILTGRNEKLYHRLAGRYAQIEAVPFTDRVPEYMGRAHLMLSKPGGITVFEAIAARLPMLAWEPFLEQERENARFLVQGGMARVAPKEEGACLSAIRETIYDRELLAEMGRAMDRLAGALDGEGVCAAVRKAVGGGRVCA